MLDVAHPIQQFAALLPHAESWPKIALAHGLLWMVGSMISSAGVSGLFARPGWSRRSRGTRDLPRWMPQCPWLSCQYLVLDRYFVCSEPDTRSLLSAVARNNKESRQIVS